MGGAKGRAVPLPRKAGFPGAVRAPSGKRTDNQVAGEPGADGVPALGLRGSARQQQAVRRLLASADFVEALAAFRRKWFARALYDPELANYLAPLSPPRRSVVFEMLDEYRALARRFRLNPSADVAKDILLSDWCFSADDDADEVLRSLPDHLSATVGVEVPHEGRCELVRGRGESDRIPLRSTRPPFAYDLRRYGGLARIVQATRISFVDRKGVTRWAREGADFEIVSQQSIHWRAGANRPPRGTKYELRFTYSVKAPAEETLVAPATVLSYADIGANYPLGELEQEEVLFIPVDADTRRRDLLEYWPLVEARLKRAPRRERGRTTDRRLALARLMDEVGTARGRYLRAAHAVLEEPILRCPRCPGQRFYERLDDPVPSVCPRCRRLLEEEEDSDIDRVVQQLRSMDRRSRAI
jgi:hypothetical protein